MKTKSMLHVLFSSGLLAFATTIASAENPVSAQLEGKIQRFYQQMNEGNYEAAFEFLATGSSGFLPTGMLIEIKSDEVRAYAVEDATAKRQAGRIQKLHPKHLSLRMLGEDHALATYYVDGEITDGGTTTEVMNRASLVLGKHGDEWKIEHWHASSLSAEDLTAAE